MSMRKKGLIILGIAVIALVLLLYEYQSGLSAIVKVMTEGTLEDMVLMIRSWGIWAPIISILLMVFQAFAAPIPSFLVAGANGVIFGIGWGAVISWTGAMLGAGGTFYLARIMGADFIKKLEKDSRLIAKVEEISEKHGFKVVLIGRLLPFVSFDFMSYAAGLSNMKAREFFIATGVGMIPGTLAYVLLGNEIMALSVYSDWLTGAAILLILVAVGFSSYKSKYGRDRR